MAVREVKVCLLGESGVGKSSIVLRFVNDSFKPALESTIGASFMTKRLDVDGVSYQFQIWDTAGQEKATFRTVKDWVRELKRNCTTDLVLAIAGNKSDLNDLREVRVREAEEYAQSIGAHFIETSALSAINVPQLFKAIAEELPPEDSISVRPGSTVHLRRHDENKETQTSCCGSKKSR
ncbi:ras-related protein Rab-22A-like isoform X2 [Ostrea edulis]|uniref:ras-related protein Rab-22A-like isoform X2 n=1 Tax=Ostrea edulis TaxID=37623 RepID=UPI0020949F11|nr:ras-related protein Rab-22A-like isoform X2 [Ostrea edulis]